MIGASGKVVLDSSFVRPFRELDLDDLPIVGGKNANLGVLLNHLVAAGVRVPDGFAITADAFRHHLREARIEDEIYAELDGSATSRS